MLHPAKKGPIPYWRMATQLTPKLVRLTQRVISPFKQSTRAWCAVAAAAGSGACLYTQEAAAASVDASTAGRVVERAVSHNHRVCACSGTAVLLPGLAHLASTITASTRHPDHQGAAQVTSTKVLCRGADATSCGSDVAVGRKRSTCWNLLDVARTARIVCALACSLKPLADVAVGSSEGDTLQDGGHA